ncbi:MAG: non-ribosomal peptide synthetase, partial [Cyanobacteriota bacterium]|nr:non-ribosomal peptide synthetase [Cyanobacteriota bacterium]
DLQAAFTNIFTSIKQQINQVNKNKTFNRDIVTRYPQLNSLQNLNIEQHLPVTVQLIEKLADYHPSNKNKFVLVIAQNGDCACFYDENCYENIAIEKLLTSLTIFAEQLALNSHHNLANLSLISSQDWVKLEQWNNSDTVNRKNQLIHQLFEAQVELTPNAIAVQDIQHEQTLTYKELNQRANQLAHYLQSKGIEPDVLVGICVERSVEMMISILAVLKAGGAYLPIDSNYPTERIALIMSDARISLMLTQEPLINNLPEQETQIFCLDRDWDRLTNQNDQNPVSQTTPEHLAYVIYTSGSTGKPKGVMIQHDSLVNFTQAAVKNYSIVECDRILQFASISFDAAAEEIYPCLINGGTLVLRSEEMLSSVTHFLQNCRDWQITVLDLPTAYWQQIAIEIKTGNITLPASLRLVIIGGERVSPEHVKIWQTHVGDYPQLINTYGPTEATVVATVYPITSNLNIHSEVPIGKPIANVQTYVLDRNLQPLPIGIKGELHIGGIGLARGYLNRPELTKEKFIPNPFLNSPWERLYKTGDLVRYLPDGNIEFLGRIDNQVKIRGFRIELGEIESVLNTHAQVNQAVVIAREDIPVNKRLVAYLVTKNETLTTKQLRQFIKSKLPEYMVPSAFVILDKLPFTPNGKVDTKALPVPDKSSIQLENNFVPPSNPTEDILATIWSNILGVEKIGIHDNFFELGGHSLLATQVISRIRQEFSVEMPLKSLFEKPTISGLSDSIQTLVWLQESQSENITVNEDEMEEIEF